MVYYTIINIHDEEHESCLPDQPSKPSKLIYQYIRRFNIDESLYVGDNPPHLVT